MEDLSLFSERAVKTGVAKWIVKHDQKKEKLLLNKNVYNSDKFIYQAVKDEDMRA